MDSYIDLQNIGTKELGHVDLDRVDVYGSPPDVEPQRQYYFMADCEVGKRTSWPSAICVYSDLGLSDECQRLGKADRYPFGCRL